MKRYLIAFLAAGALALPAAAQVNSASDASWLERAILMYRDANYVGCLDQLDAAPGFMDQSMAERADFYRAMSAMRVSQPGAAVLLQRFVDAYPASVLRSEALLALAAEALDSSEWQKALEILDSIDPDSLDEDNAARWSIARAIALINTGHPDDADRLLRSVTAPDYARQAAFYRGYILFTQGDYDQAETIFRYSASDPAYRAKSDVYLAQILYMKSDWSQALSVAQRSIGNPSISTDQSAELQRVAGEASWHLGDNRSAVSYLSGYRQAVADPRPSALYILALADYEDGRYAQSISTLNDISDRDDAIGQSALLLLGQAYEATGNSQAALLALSRAASMDYDEAASETALYDFAVARLNGGKVPFGSSVEGLEAFLSRFPDSPYAPKVQEYIITGYMTDNNYERALRSIESVKSPSPALLRAKQQVLYTLGTRDLAAGNTSLALSRLRQAADMRSQNPDIALECNLWIGECLYAQSDYSGAAASYLAYLKGARDGSYNRALALYDLGYARFAEKRFNDAMTDFNRFLKNPAGASAAMRADAWNRIADCYYYSSRFSSAAQCYERAFDTDPSTGDYALYQLAVMKGLSRDHKAKIEGMERMMNQFPSSALIPSALLEIAEAQGELGDRDAAIATYSRLASSFPSTPQGRQGLLLLAITKADAGDRAGAIAAYKQVVKSSPTSEEARVANDDLKRLYAEAGDISGYASFINSIPNAPAVDSADLEAMAFSAAERSHNASGDVTLMEKYLSQFPDGPHAAVALLAVADWQARSGMTDKAVDSYRGVIDRAPDAATLNRARLGLLRSARDMGLHADVIEMADALLSSSAVGTSDRSEVAFARAVALAGTGRDSEAVSAWTQLAANPLDLNGAKSAYWLAQHYFDKDDLAQARAVAEKLVDANPPHPYWLARTFILIADINKAEGNDTEARLYLTTLRDNYPGSETDIMMMIEERLD